MLAYCFHDTKVKFNLSIGNSKLSHYSPFYTCRNCNHSTCKLFGLYKIFYWCEPVECIECQKNKREVERFRIVLNVVSIGSMQITYPFAYFPQTEISWFFNDISICCTSFYVIFVKDEFFHVNFAFKSEKLQGNVHLQPQRYLWRSATSWQLGTKRWVYSHTASCWMAQLAMYWPGSHLSLPEIVFD